MQGGEYPYERERERWGEREREREEEGEREKQASFSNLVRLCSFDKFKLLNSCIALFIFSIQPEKNTITKSTSHAGRSLCLVTELRSFLYISLSALSMRLTCWLCLRYCSIELFIVKMLGLVPVIYTR